MVDGPLVAAVVVAGMLTGAFGQRVWDRSSFGRFQFDHIVELRGRDVDVVRRRLHVRQSATLVNGNLTWDPPKTHRARTIVIPRFLAAELAAHVDGDGLLFTSPGGAPLRSPNFLRRVWNPAVTQCQFGDLVPHDLRHTAASVAISAGASVKAVQRMLGHRSAQITLDRYSHLFRRRPREPRREHGCSVRCGPGAAPNPMPTLP